MRIKLFRIRFKCPYCKKGMDPKGVIVEVSPIWLLSAAFFLIAYYCLEWLFSL